MHSLTYLLTYFQLTHSLTHAYSFIGQNASAQIHVKYK